MGRDASGREDNNSVLDVTTIDPNPIMESLKLNSSQSSSTVSWKELKLFRGALHGGSLAKLLIPKHVGAATKREWKGGSQPESERLAQPEADAKRAGALCCTAPRDSAAIGEQPMT